jgi:hypothetical protein
VYSNMLCPIDTGCAVGLALMDFTIQGNDCDNARRLSAHLNLRANIIRSLKLRACNANGLPESHSGWFIRIVRINGPVGGSNPVVISCIRVEIIGVSVALHISPYLIDLLIGSIRRRLSFNLIPCRGGGIISPDQIDAT